MYGQAQAILRGMAIDLAKLFGSGATLVAASLKPRIVSAVTDCCAVPFLHLP